jgi:acyl carrier protein
MRTIGIVAETDAFQRHQQLIRGMQPVEDADLFALLEHYCDPMLPPLDEDHSQLLVGAVHPARFHVSNKQPPSWLAGPLFTTFATTKHKQGHEVSQSGDQEDAALLFAQAKSFKSRTEVVLTALREKVACALGVQPDDIDTRKTLSDYGVDSLMAVELRSWFRRDFQTVVAVFEIMGGKSIRSVSELIAGKSSE